MLCKGDMNFPSHALHTRKVYRPFKLVQTQNMSLGDLGGYTSLILTTSATSIHYLAGL